MERRRGRGRARVRHQEDVLAAHLAELKADLSACKDARTATKLARYGCCTQGSSDMAEGTAD